MTIPFFVLIIEKADGDYSGYTPNVAGVTATGTREQVERSLISQIEKHVANLQGQHGRKIEITTLPLEEKIQCVEVIGEGKKWAGACKTPARKQGLCWQHWKLRYSHSPHGTIGAKECILCGERDPLLLGSWDSFCEFKANNLEWPRVLAEKRTVLALKKRHSAEKEKRRKKMAALPIRCSALRTQGPKGVRCSNLAVRDGLCTSHWKQRPS
jgi:hypothetical protein